MIHKVTSAGETKWRYPWPEMDVGDSFIIPEDLMKSTPIKLVVNANKRYSKNGRKFTKAKNFVLRIK